MPYPSKIDPDTILETALGILETEGRQALSMRRLAEALGVQASSLYRHYPDKNALEQGIAAHSANKLRKKLETLQKGTPQQALQHTANAYLKFARTQPYLYDMMMTQFTPATASESKALWNLLLAITVRITGNPDDTPAAVALWSFLHGYATLERSGMFGASGPKGALEVGINAFITGLPRKTKSR